MGHPRRSQGCVKQPTAPATHSCRNAKGGMHQDSCFTNSIADKPGSVANEVADLCHSLCFDNRAAMFPMQADTLTALRRSM